MNRKQSFRFPNQFLPAIFGIGCLIGVANYSMGFGPNLGTLLFIQIVTSFIVGYGLLLIVFNIDTLFTIPATAIRLAFLAICFVALGVLASEVEHVNRSLLFHEMPYRVLGGRSAYVFNGVIALILGFSFYFNLARLDRFDDRESMENKPRPKRLPVRKGREILLKDFDEIHFFRASDNYCIAVDEMGEENLCEVGLGNLERILDDRFTRVHRSYIVNLNQIRRISSYDKRRYTLDMVNGKVIRSGASFASTVRELTRIPSISQKPS